MAVCKPCNGKGAVNCPRCQGKGGFSDVIFGYSKCEQCGGTGKLQCPSCKGTGEVRG